MQKQETECRGVDASRWMWIRNTRPPEVIKRPLKLNAILLLGELRSGEPYQTVMSRNNDFH